jgi:hypothetical protein
MVCMAQLKVGATWPSRLGNEQNHGSNSFLMASSPPGTFLLTQYSSFPLIYSPIIGTEGRVFLAASNSITAVNISSGEPVLLWSFATTAVSGPPALSEFGGLAGNVVFRSGSNVVSSMG